MPSRAGPHRLWTTLAPPATRPSVTPPWIVTGRVMPMIVSSPSRVKDPADPSGPEGDGWMLGDVEDLLEGLADLCAVGVGERLDAAGSLPDVEGVDVDLEVTEEFAGTAVSTLA